MIDRLDERFNDVLEWLSSLGSGPSVENDDPDEPDPDDEDEADTDDENEDDIDDEDEDDPDEDEADAGDRETRSDGGTRESSADAGDSEGDGERPDWEAVESPTSRTLHDVVHGVDGPYVAGEGGIMLYRDDGEWRILLERGPGVAENTLRSIDATDDGCRLWFAGDSGALGCYDVADGTLSDYSAPMEKTSTWEAIAVTGATDEEQLRIANGSGEVLDCTVEDGCPVWGDVVEPGGGSTIPGLTAGPSGGFYAIDTSGGAYYEDPDGEWERIGVENAEVDFHDVWAGDEAVYIAGSDGIAYRYDPDCENWTPIHVGQGALQTIRSTRRATVATATGGRIYHRLETVRWAELEAPTEQTLLGLTLARSSDDVEAGLAPTPVDVAVGAGGTVLERPLDGRSDDDTDADSD